MYYGVEGMIEFITTGDFGYGALSTVELETKKKREDSLG